MLFKSNEFSDVQVSPITSPAGAYTVLIINGVIVVKNDLLFKNRLFVIP
jgi:hypothetical protein